jgi:hypothetical protein
MKASDKDDFDLASPLDFWEMMVVAWIRLAASTGHAFLVATAPRPEPARTEPDKERTLAEEKELLLHVLE